MFTSLLLQVVTLSFLGLKCHAHSAAITICLKFIRKNNQNIFMPLLSAINLNQMKTNHSFPFISGRSNVISKKYQPFRFFPSFSTSATFQTLSCPITLYLLCVAVTFSRQPCLKAQSVFRRRRRAAALAAPWLHPSAPVRR